MIGMEQPDFSIEVERPERVAAPPVTQPVVQPVTNTINTMESSITDPEDLVEVKHDMPSKKETTTSYMAETIEIAQPQRIFPHIESYPESSPKQHHFRLKHRSDQMRLINLWNQYGITAELNESGKNNVDVTLIKDNRTVGKIQFLHFDRRDRAVRAKHYVKVYLYQFEDSTSFDRAKQIMIEYFDQIGHAHRSPRRTPRKTTKRSTKRSYKRSHRTMRKPIR
jgi:hypothetical protein